MNVIFGYGIAFADGNRSENGSHRRLHSGLQPRAARLLVAAAGSSVVQSNVVLGNDLAELVLLTL